MAAQPRVLISGGQRGRAGAGVLVAGLRLLPDRVERTAHLRAGGGGHAVDLFGPVVDVMDWMGLRDQIRQARTTTEVMTLIRPGRRGWKRRWRCSAPVSRTGTWRSRAATQRQIVVESTRSGGVRLWRFRGHPGGQRRGCRQHAVPLLSGLAVGGLLLSDRLLVPARLAKRIR